MQYYSYQAGFQHDLSVQVFGLIPQGLYEYVCPSWQTRARPSVEDYDVKSFGSSVPAKVMNPNSNPLKLPDSASGKAEGINPPRYSSLQSDNDDGRDRIFGNKTKNLILDPNYKKSYQS